MSNHDTRPDFTNTEPAVTIGPFSQWNDVKKIVAMDPWGHMAPWLFNNLIKNEDSPSYPQNISASLHTDGIQLIFGPP